MDKKQANFHWVKSKSPHEYAYTKLVCRMKALSLYFENVLKKSKLTFASKVSPAKMALRRHLSQERLTTPHQPGSSEQQQQQQPGLSNSVVAESKVHHSQHHHPHQQLQQQSSRAESSTRMHPPSTSGNGPGAGGNGNGGLLGTRTIGDLVSGEIERTLEISNQTIINAAVDMSVIGRPDNAYSPISRPASAEGETGLATLAHVASYAPTPSAPTTPTPSNQTSRSSVLYPPQQSQSQRWVGAIVDVKKIHDRHRDIRILRICILY